MEFFEKKRFNLIKLVGQFNMCVIQMKKKERKVKRKRKQTLFMFKIVFYRESFYSLFRKFIFDWCQTLCFAFSRNKSGKTFYPSLEVNVEKVSLKIV